MAYEIRPMSLAELLDTGFRVVRDQPGLLIGLAARVYLPLAAFAIAIDALGFRPDADPTGAQLAAIVMVGLVALLYFAVVNPLVAVATTHAVAELYLARRPTASESLRKGFSLFLPLVGTSLLYSLIVAVGLLLFVVPGVYAAIVFALYTQVIVVEEVAGSTALGRSRELMQENVLRGIGVFLVCGILVSVLSGAAEFSFSFVPWLGSLASAAAQSVGYAFSTAVAVAFYFDLRCRKEAFDLEHLADVVATRNPPASSTSS